MSHAQHDPSAPAAAHPGAAPPAPHSHDRPQFDRRRSHYGLPLGPPDNGVSVAEAALVVRMIRWAAGNKGWLVALLAAVGGTYKARPEYLAAATGLVAGPATLDTIRGRVARLESTSAATLRFEDSSRVDRAALRRELTQGMTPIARAICTLQTPTQRQAGGLPCATLLNGGHFDPAGTGR